MSDKFILPPNPSRLIEGLRDTGYEFKTALADIVDNSVDADSCKILINIEMEADGDLYIAVADDGCGMSKDELKVAMTYGADSVNKSPDRLGKFGLGLKTASTAFCRRLSVISRGKSDDVPTKMIWDLDHVCEVNEWEALIDTPDRHEVEMLDKVANGGHGTLVIWEKVDRVLQDYKNPGGAHARNALHKLCDEFIEHVEMVYQRFLDTNDKRARNVVMNVNGRELEPWDPFCRDLENTEVVADMTKVVELDGERADFTIKAYVLPRKEQFEDKAQAKNAKISNEYQGFYIYRENRLIKPHNWLGMYSKEPHLSLLRVEFSFDHRLDNAFHVDIKKSEIRLVSELYDWIKDHFLPAPRNAANDRYRKGERKIVHGKGKDSHADSNANIHGKENAVKQANVRILDRATNEVEVENKLGVTRMKIKIEDAIRPGEVHVKVVASLDDNALWEPALIEENHAVLINAGHSYYSKVYVPNLKSGVTVQGMDSLLWALAEAELGTVNEETKKHFRNLRFEMSKILRELLSDLPDPVMDEEEEG